jgi:hypothetical protein
MRKVEIVLEDDEWSNLKDILDAGFEHMEAEGEDEAFLEELTRTWARLRRQLRDQGVEI